MPIYSEKYNGFIADVANIDFKRCDGKIYSCKHATATSITPNVNVTEITGGQSQYPIGFIDAGRGLECSFTNAMFDMDMFEIMNTGDAVDGEQSILESKSFTVTTGPAITMPFDVDENSVYIRGLEKAATAEAGKFTVQTGEGTTTITLFSSDAAVGDDVQVSYLRKVDQAHSVAVTTTTSSARGEVWMHWPIYTDGKECKESSIKGWLHVHVFRVRVSTPPPIDSSYKTAATFATTFTAIDPGRADGKIYEKIYEEVAA